MKKLITFVVCCFLGCLNVSAAENDSQVEVQFIDYVFSNRQIGDQLYSGQQGFVYVNGQIAYCLDPTIILNSDTYSSSQNFMLANVTNEQLNYLEVVSHFGYGYTGRRDTKYYLATQEIIWEYLSGGNVYWTEGQNGEIINIDSYKNQILDSVNTYLSIPDLPSYVETYRNEDVILEDKNNAIQHYDSNLWRGTIEDNKLIISANSTGTSKIVLTKKKLNNKVSYVYVSANSQTLATFGYSGYQSHSMTVSFKVKTLTQVTLTKIDLKTKEIIKNKETKVKIYDVNRGCYIVENGSDILTIGETGVFTTETYLEEGEYRIEEISAPAGYKKLTKPLTFLVQSHNGPVMNVDIYNQQIAYSITIEKQGENYLGVKQEGNKLRGIYELVDISNVKYGLYAREDIVDFQGNIIYSKDALVTHINIKNGFGVTLNLKYGKYYLKEIECPEEYILDDTITNIDLTGSESIMSLKFTNYLKKGDLIIHKTDGQTGLPGAEFTLKGKKYRYTIKLISDDLGYSIIEDIPYDSYSLKEIKVPEGYKIDPEKKTITLEESNLQYNFINEKESVKEVPEEEPQSSEPHEKSIDDEPPAPEPEEDPKEQDLPESKKEEDNPKIEIGEKSPEEEISKHEENASEESSDVSIKEADESLITDYNETVVENPNTAIIKNDYYLSQLLFHMVLIISVYKYTKKL